jgi:hypothetical protein
VGLNFGGAVVNCAAWQGSLEVTASWRHGGQESGGFGTQCTDEELHKCGEKKMWEKAIKRTKFRTKNSLATERGQQGSTARGAKLIRLCCT